MKLPSIFPDKSQTQKSKSVVMLESFWSLTAEQLLAARHTTPNGIQQPDAENRLKQY